MERKGQSFLSQSVVSNLKFWGKGAEKVFLLFVLMVIVYTFIMSLCSAGGDGIKEAVRQIKIYAVAMGIMMPLMGINSYAVPWIGIAMSFGARRSETLWGIQFMSWLVAIQIFLFLAVGNWLTGGSFIWMEMYLPILMMSVGVGELLGCANLRFGWKGVLMTVLCSCVAVGGIAGLLLRNGGLRFLLDGQTGKMLLTLSFAAIFLCAAGVWCWKKILFNYEVRV